MGRLVALRGPFTRGVHGGGERGGGRAVNPSAAEGAPRQQGLRDRGVCAYTGRCLLLGDLVAQPDAGKSRGREVTSAG